MNVVRPAALLLPALAGASPALAVLPEPVRKALAAAAIPADRAALWVQELGAARPSAEHNAGAAMNPASVIKLVTTYSALELLGPTYVWKTEAWTSAPLA